MEGAAEGGPGNHGDPGDIEKEFRQLIDGMDGNPLVASRKKPRDIRENIKGSFRRGTANPGDPVEGLHDPVPPPPVLHKHRRKELLSRANGIGCRLLGNGVGVRGRLALDGIHRLHDLPGTGGIPDPPPRHRIGLGDAVDDDRSCPQGRIESGDRGNRNGGIVDFFVDLVGDDQKIVLQDDFGNPFKTVAVEDRPGGVVRRVEDQDLGAGRQDGGEGLRLKAKSVLFPTWNKDGLSLVQENLVRVGNPGRRGKENLIPRVDQNLKELEKGMLGAIGGHNLPGRKVEPLVSPELLPNRLLELGDAADGRVLGKAFFQCLDRRVLDGRGGVEVRLSSGKVEDIDSFGLQLPGTRREEQGRRRLQKGESGGKHVGQGTRHSLLSPGVFLPKGIFHRQRNEVGKISAKLGDLANGGGGDEHIVFRRHEKDRLDVPVEVLVDQGHPEFVVEVGHGPHAPQDASGSRFPDEVDQKMGESAD